MEADRKILLETAHGQTAANEFRHTPVPGFKRMDLRTSAALVFTFQKQPAPKQPAPKR